MVPVTNGSDGNRLRQLEERLSKLRGETSPRAAHQEAHYSQAQMAWRMVIELVAGLGIGFGIGIGLDALLGTQPWMLVLFTLLGFAAGVQTMLRTAAEVQAGRKAAREAAETQADETEDTPRPDGRD